MFKKLILKNKIKKMQKEIKALEMKRMRSQSVLVEAILTRSVPDDRDVEYFNQYTSQINSIRDDMHVLEKQLAQL